MLTGNPRILTSEKTSDLEVCVLSGKVCLYSAQQIILNCHKFASGIVTS